MGGLAMSSAESESVGQTLLNEAMDRLGEQAASLGMPRLVAIDHLQKSLHEARKRVNDTHAMQMQALGYDVKTTEHDDMGINVAGDTHINITSPQANEGGSMLKKALPTIATLLAGSVLPLAGIFLANYLNRGAAPAPASGPPDSAYDVLFYDADGNPIKVQPLSERPTE